MRLPIAFLCSAIAPIALLGVALSAQETASQLKPAQNAASAPQTNPAPNAAPADAAQKPTAAPSNAAQNPSAAPSTPSNAASAPAAPGAQSATPAIRTVSSLVVVDVVVSHDGKPVKGLQRGAFHIFEDGHEQTVKIFEEHNSADPSQLQTLPALPPNVHSNFPETSVTTAANVLLLDALNTPLKDQMYVRKEMLEYLKNIPAGTRIAIFTLASRLRIVQGFTTDRTVLQTALSGKENPATSSSLLADADDTTSTSLNNGFQEAGASAQVLASLQQFQADQQAFQTDLRVQMTLEALQQLASYLAGVPGRKNLIWFSGSFPIELEPNASLSNEFSVARDYSDKIRTTDDLLTTSRVAVYPVDARGLFPASMFSASNAGSNYSGVSHASPNMGGAGTRSGSGPRARNPKPNAGGGNANNPNSFANDRNKFFQTTAAEHATMDQIAQETGGHAYYDTNGIKEALADAVEHGENYYTLAYTSDDSKLDGKFRRIQVKLPDQNDHLAYRTGYFADGPEARGPNAQLDPSAAAMQRGAPPSSQVLFKVRVLASDDPALKGLQSQPGPAGLMAAKLPGPVKRYWIDYAVDMHQVAVSQGTDGLFHSSVEFVAIAYDRDGKTINVQARAFNLNLQPAQREHMMQTGLPMHEELDVPAGEIYLRLGVHDRATGRVGSVEIPLRVSSDTPKS